MPDNVIQFPVLEQEVVPESDCTNCIHFLEGPSGMFCGALMEWLMSVRQADCDIHEAV